MIASVIQIRCYPVKKRGVKAKFGKFSLKGRVTNLVKSFGKSCVNRVHLQMILKCIYTVICKDSQVGHRRSTGHEAMLIRFDIRNY